MYTPGMSDQAPAGSSPADQSQSPRTPSTTASTRTRSGQSAPGEESIGPEPPLLHALSAEQIRTAIDTACGMTAGIFMRRHPDDVMPSRTIEVGVDEIMAELLA